MRRERGREGGMGSGVGVGRREGAGVGRGAETGRHGRAQLPAVEAGRAQARLLPSQGENGGNRRCRRGGSEGTRDSAGSVLARGGGAGGGELRCPACGYKSLPGRRREEGVGSPVLGSPFHSGPGIRKVFCVLPAVSGMGNAVKGDSIVGRIEKIAFPPSILQCGSVTVSWVLVKEITICWLCLSR